MAETATENAVCGKCGAEVREGTVFCYACGARVVVPPEADKIKTEPEANGSGQVVDKETQAALDDLAEKLQGTEVTDTDRLAKAATERKKARVVQKKSRDFTWEPREDAPVSILILALFAAVLVAIVVFVTVVWK
jgi:uncharacterized Zn finger protein (UPF0148 family)